MKKYIFAFIAFFCATVLPAQTIYDFVVTNDEGRQVSLAEYRGKVMLIVNTATRCGFTPQYTELEKLYAKYRAEGLEILDFPCNQFGEQAPGTIQEIHQFCTANFDIHFAQFDKIDVNGDNAAPLYTYLKSQKGFKGFDLNNKTGKMLDEMFRKRNPDYDKSADIKWNFTKFLVARDGRVVARYEPTDDISAIDADVRNELNPQNKQDMEKNMNEVQAYLKECGAFYIATADGDQPRVRPFGVSEIIDGNLYIMTGKKKDVYKQIAANGKFEICALKPSGTEWMRLSGTLLNDETLKVKETFLERNPGLKSMYKADDDNMSVLRITQATARFCSFAAPERRVSF